MIKLKQLRNIAGIIGVATLMELVLIIIKIGIPILQMLQKTCW